MPVVRHRRRGGCAVLHFRVPERQNSSLLEGDVSEAVRALKQEDGPDLHVIGSAELVRTLFERDLVDELPLMVDPVVLWGGKRIFPDDGRSGHCASPTARS